MPCSGGLLLFSSPSPFPFCLLSSLSVEAGGRGAELVQAAFAELGAVRGNALPPRRGWGAGGKRNLSEAPSSSSSARCTFPTPSLSIALKNRRAFVGARAGEEGPTPAGLERARAGQGAAEVCTGPGIGLGGMRTLRSEAPGRWDLRRLLLPSFLLRGRGGAAGVRALAAVERSQVQAQRAWTADPLGAFLPSPGTSRKFMLLTSTFPAGARSERPYARRRARRESCALSLFWRSSLVGGWGGWGSYPAAVFP